MAEPIIVPTDKPSIYDVLDSLTTLERQAIVRPTNPPPGIAGFIFHIPEEEEVQLRSEISKHFVEANTTITDQIALLPEEVTLRGLVAEIVAVTPSPDQVAKIPAALPLNPATAPELTDYQIQQTDPAQTPEQIQALSSQSLFEFFNARAGQPPNQTKQSRTFAYFYQLQRGRQLVTVETPWGFFTNMAIQLVRAQQGDETKFRSSFSITFEKIRTAGSSVVVAGQLAGRAFQQSAPVTQNGTAGKSPVTDDDQASLLYRMTQGP